GGRRLRSHAGRNGSPSQCGDFALRNPSAFADLERHFAGARLEIPTASAEVAAAEVHAASEVAPAPEAVRSTGTSPAPVAPAAVGPAEQLADEQAGEEAG